MDTSRYRIRPLRAADIDAALELMAQADPGRSTESEAAHRYLLELMTAPAGAEPGEEGLRAMAKELDQLTDTDLPEDEIRRRLHEKLTSGPNMMSALVALVAEETTTGEIVGLISAGPPGKWSRRALAEMPAPMGIQMCEQIVEISHIAVAPGARRQRIASGLLNGLLNSDSEVAKGWRLAMWFFHEDRGFGDFHRAMAPEWPVGKHIAFLDSERQASAFREMTGDLRACVAPLHPDVELIMSPTGVPVIGGLFKQPWPWAQSLPAPRSAPKPSKADRKADKKARGRARG
ncbi:GNAT family N-acetyltransferase [Streptomyces sp. NPDC088707]|uniref:GNAT family N-acetyltransferase n=1 Tax=Streptomyces sp. NPDC088707 TaxID=3365871 RepID=UPI00380C9CB3